MEKRLSEIVKLQNRINLLTEDLIDMGVSRDTVCSVLNEDCSVSDVLKKASAQALAI